MDNPVNKAPETPRKPVLAVPGPISTTATPAPESAPEPESAPVAVSPVSPEISPPAPERMTGKDEPWAYLIQDSNFGDFYVLNSANAWWLDRGKVERLISAYKIDSTNEEACAYAGIRPTNLQYFEEQHPDFSYVKAACKQLLKLAARDKIARAINSKKASEEIPHLAQANWYAERKLKDEFSTRAEVVDPRTAEMNKVTEELKQLIDDVAKLTEDDEIRSQALGARSEEDRKPGTLPDEGGRSESDDAAGDTTGATDTGPEAAPPVPQ
jgi:hypothetical protein